MFDLTAIAETAGYVSEVPVADGQITGINIILLGIIALTVAAVGGGFVYTVYAVVPMGRTVTSIFVIGGAVGLSLVGTSLGMEMFALTFPERLRVLQVTAVGVITGGGYTAVRYRPKKLQETDNSDDSDDKDDNEPPGTESESEPTTDQMPRATKAVPEVTDHE